MNRSIIVGFALLGLIGFGTGCTANVENPTVDQTGREGDTSCVTQCDDSHTTCVAKCNDDTCKAACKTTYDECSVKCTSTATGGKTS